MAYFRSGQDNISGKNQSINRLWKNCQLCYKRGHLACNCRTQIQCQICKIHGHAADKCYFRDAQSQQPVNVVQENYVICQLCSKPGHHAKFCKIYKTNEQNKPYVICQWCDKPGHTANNCWKKQNKQYNINKKSKIACQICYNFGHIAKDCRSKLEQTAVSVDSLFCHYCKKRGHLLKNCKLRITSNNYMNEPENSDGFLEVRYAIGDRTSSTSMGVTENVNQNAWEPRPVMINLDKHSRPPTVQIKICESTSPITFALDTGYEINLIKENFVPKNKTINYDNILELNGIYDYPTYTLGEINLLLYGKEITFHIVTNDFPILQPSILGNDFFYQTSAKINYAKGHLDVFGINLPFFSPEMIIVAPRLKSPFYIRVENPEIRIGDIPRLKIAHGIYAIETLAEVSSGKAYIDVVSNLDEEIEVQVPTLRLRSFSIVDQEVSNKIYEEEIKENINNKDKTNNNCNVNLKNDEDKIINENKNIIEEENKTINKEIQMLNKKEGIIENKSEDEIEIKEKDKHTLTQKNKNLKEKSILEQKSGSYASPEVLDSRIGGGNYQTPRELSSDPKVVGNEDFHISPGLPRDPRILEEGSYQTSLELTRDPKIHEGGDFQTFLGLPRDPEILGGGSYQTSPVLIDDPEILGGGSYQTPRKSINNSEILKGKEYQIPLKNYDTIKEDLQNSIMYSSVDCKEGSNQTSLCNTTRFFLKESKTKSSLVYLKKLKFTRIGINIKNKYNKNNNSHIAIEELIRRTKFYNARKLYDSKKKNKPLSKILVSMQVQSQKIIEKFMRRRKSKHKEEINSNEINDDKILNLNDPENAKLISTILKDSNEKDKGYEDFNFSDEKRGDSLSNDVPVKNSNQMLFTYEEMYQPLKLQIKEKISVHESFKSNKIQFQDRRNYKFITILYYIISMITTLLYIYHYICQHLSKLFKSLKKYKYEPEEIENRNDPPDKGYLTYDEDIKDKKQLDSQEQKNKIEDRNDPPDKINDIKDDGRTRDKDEELKKDEQNQILSKLRINPPLVIYNYLKILQSISTIC
ncbi:uncharacterized protein LOC118646187 [Monomorium pharaonis]|uniref:uncharacterized protein LOC118645268 n=1 Tax=Monomorium pharaonis TaxID=307658 RepID=UPI0017462DE6|nr:uncharacterized protein LOC118645268 [Monomorium pharaonis]XP_036144447.1 uncharacterized protein LOC118646187 [Monomorium pharaonis]